MKMFQDDGAITADLQMLRVFNLLLQVKWSDFEPFVNWGWGSIS